jgi:hypothetical protein
MADLNFKPTFKINTRTSALSSSMIKTVGHHSNLILPIAFLLPHHDNLHHCGAHHQSANQCRAFPDAIYSGLRRYQKTAHVIHIKNNQAGVARRGADWPVCVAAKSSER